MAGRYEKMRKKAIIFTLIFAAIALIGYNMPAFFSKQGNDPGQASKPIKTTASLKVKGQVKHISDSNIKVKTNYNVGVRRESNQ